MLQGIRIWLEERYLKLETTQKSPDLTKPEIIRTELSVYPSTFVQIWLQANFLAIAVCET